MSKSAVRSATKGGEDVLTKERLKPAKRTRTRLKRPQKWKVLFHNDDYTPREFVVLVLKIFFHRGEAEARRIMLHIHRTGIGVVGIFTKEIAETKVVQTMKAAEKAGHPLLCTMEPADDGEEE